MALTKDQFLAKCARRYIEVDGVRIQSLKLSEYSEWEAGRIDFERGKVTQQRMMTQRSRLLVKVIVDENGNRMFEDDDYQLIDELDASISDLYDAAIKHCGFDRDFKDDESKKSQSTQS